MEISINVDDFEVDARILASSETINSMASIIEETMDWYDHAAFAFLVYREPLLAIQKISALVSNKTNGKDWRNLVITPFLNQNVSSDRCVNQDCIGAATEALILLKQFKVLSQLNINCTNYPMVNLDSFRRTLFYVIDDLDLETGKRLIQLMNTGTVRKIEPQACLELDFLIWLQDGEISPYDCVKLRGKLKELEIGHLAALLENAQQFIPGPPLLHSVSEGSDISISSLPPSSMSIEKPSKFNVLSGLCIIINQTNFFYDATLPCEMLEYASKDLGFRLGSDRDRDNLAETFKMLGFHVEIYENLTYRKLMETVVNISRYDFSNYDALVFCLLSHGKRDSIYSSDSIEVPVDVIRTHFDGIHCRTLCRKPKLFFVQACKGEIHHGSVKSDDYEQDSGIVSPNAPVVCNFFEAWATIPGYVAYRSKYSGSVFISILCKTFQDYGHAWGLNDLMTCVNSRMADWKLINKQNNSEKKQMTQHTSSLTNDVQFNRADQEKFVDALADALERLIMDKLIENASRELWVGNPTLFK